MAHWRTIHTSDYLSSVDIEGNTNVTVKSVSAKTQTFDKGKKETLPIATLEGEFKPLILNRTNCKTLEKLSGSGEIEDWAGMTVTLTVEKVRFGSEMVDGIRIAPVLPKTFDPAPGVSALKAAADLAGLKSAWDALTPEERKHPQILDAKDAKKVELDKAAK